MEITSSKDSNAPDSQLMKESFKIDIFKALKTLPAKESDILCLYFE